MLLIAFNGLMKITSFLKVFENLGLLVNLFETCIADIIPFCFLFFIYISFFTVGMEILGATAPERDGLGKGSLNMYMFIWENSIGSINDPAFTKNSQQEGLA